MHTPLLACVLGVLDESLFEQALGQRVFCLQMRERLMKYHSKHVKITEDSYVYCLHASQPILILVCSTCAICHRALRVHAFAVHPCGTCAMLGDG
jgi:hypothetical protein